MAEQFIDSLRDLARDKGKIVDKAEPYVSPYPESLARLNAVFGRQVLEGLHVTPSLELVNQEVLGGLGKPGQICKTVSLVRLDLPRHSGDIIPEEQDFFGIAARYLTWSEGKKALIVGVKNGEELIVTYQSRTNEKVDPISELVGWSGATQKLSEMGIQRGMPVPGQAVPVIQRFVTQELRKAA